MIPRLQAGDEQQCQRCGAWHVLEQSNTGGTAYAQSMLYITCGGAPYFAGTVGTVPRHPTRPRSG